MLYLKYRMRSDIRVHQRRRVYHDITTSLTTWLETTPMTLPNFESLLSGGMTQGMKVQIATFWASARQNDA